MRNWRFTWTEEQEQILINHVKNGGSDRDLVKNNIIPFSLNAIRKKKSRLFPKEKKIEYVKYNPKIKNLFKSFLLDNWKNNTPEELVVMWNKNNHTKTNRRKVISYLIMLKIKVSYNQIKKIKAYKKYIENQQYEKAREFKVNIFKQRLEKGLDLWTGLKLDDSIDPLEGVWIDGKPAEYDDN